MWELLLILQNEPLCILFSSSNGNWLASIFFYVSHMAIIKFRAHKRHDLCWQASTLCECSIQNMDIRLMWWEGVANKGLNMSAHLSHDKEMPTKIRANSGMAGTVYICDARNNPSQH